MIRRFFLFVFLLASIVCNSYAQITDTTLYLLPVTISSTKSDLQQTTSHTELLDTSSYSRLTSSSIADLLNRESGLFVKSYGAGALATVSLRGSAAAHTAVYWNGFNIQSPMHGVADLSLIPAFLTDNIKLQYGGNGPLGGSGSLGGAIHLKQSNIYNNGLSVELLSTAGSFNHFREGVALGYGGKKFTNQTRYYHEQSKNNFPFRREFDFDKIIVHQKHAAYYTNGFSQDNTFQTGNHQFGIHAFYIQSFKEIPPLMNATISTAEQEDRNAHISANWQLNKKLFTFNLHAGYLTEQLNYNDSITKLTAKSNSMTALVEASIFFHLFKNHELTFSINGNETKARADGYEFYKYRDQLTPSGSYLFKLRKRISILLGISKELAQGNELPFLPSAGINYLFKNYFSVKANAAFVYRLPTLNDLYWQPGGNQNLKSEKGFVSDASLNFLLNRNNIDIELKTGVFNNKINNWIIWLPGENQIWSPDNVNRVWSRGLEVSGQLAYTFNKITFRCKANYEYVLSTNEKVRNDAMASLDKQLIYTPRIQSKIISSIIFHGYELHYNHSYTSYRYVTSDNNQFLTPYTVAELGLLKTFSLKHILLQWNFTVENVWDENYQMIAFYAMPGRHYETGILLKYNQK